MIPPALLPSKHDSCVVEARQRGGELLRRDISAGRSYENDPFIQCVQFVDQCPRQGRVPLRLLAVRRTATEQELNLVYCHQRRLVVSRLLEDTPDVALTASDVLADDVVVFQPVSRPTF
ncbi:uncharacterized protein BcabD6B2_40280 [Babesia caballi]|uniref:Uncharacterized protein n=1 Tax=Babesia caballi TaxID=5871 RepID=A0AAV4LXZ5_BABCB|nr:hypothetical protein BcabD6B2_40280 [Babesia caballi]